MCNCYECRLTGRNEEDNNREAIRLLGFALFNLSKRNYDGTEVLLRKAYKALAGKEWDE